VTATEALRALRERWWVLVAAAFLAAAAAYAYIKLPWVEPRWRSSVAIQATGRLDYGNFLALEKELRPLAEQVRQLNIMREVDRNLHTDLSPARLLERTRAEPVQDSGQIRIDVEDSDPRRAEQLSLEIADVYARQHNAAEQGKLREERVILSTLDRSNEATLIWPQTRVLVPAAGVLGLLVAGLVVLGLMYVDDSIRSPADVQRYLELPLLGTVPRQRASLGVPAPVPAQSPEPGLTGPVAPPSAAARR
jgi:capsular polysaccharide biosynthesis protein